MSDENIRITLKAYVVNKSKWFYWYHRIDRLEAIFEFKKTKHPNLEEDPFLKNFKKNMNVLR